MKKSSPFLWAFAVLLLAGKAQAQEGYAYMSIDLLGGVHTRGGKGGWIEISAWDWVGGPSLDARQPGRTVTGGPGTLKIVLRHGPASIQLKRAFDSKRPVGRVQLEIPDPRKPTAYQAIELTNVMISGYSPSSASRPTEEVSFYYGAFHWNYVEPGPPGSLKAPAVK